MAFENALGNLLSEENVSDMTILSDLLNPKNIDMKTHIVNPYVFAVLESVNFKFNDLARSLENQSCDLKVTKGLINKFIVKYKLLMVSWNRMSRQETTDVLKSNREENTQTSRSIVQRFLGLGKK